jgi:hypothetical protein
MACRQWWHSSVDAVHAPFTLVKGLPTRCRVAHYIRLLYDEHVTLAHIALGHQRAPPVRQAAHPHGGGQTPYTPYTQCKVASA